MIGETLQKMKFQKHKLSRISQKIIFYLHKLSRIDPRFAKPAKLSDRESFWFYSNQNTDVLRLITK